MVFEAVVGDFTFQEGSVADAAAIMRRHVVGAVLPPSSSTSSSSSSRSAVQAKPKSGEIEENEGKSGSDMDDLMTMIEKNGAGAGGVRGGGRKKSKGQKARERKKKRRRKRASRQGLVYDP